MHVRDSCASLAEIDGGALRHNLTAIRQRLAVGSSLMAVVKADAYGHGAALVSPLLQAAGADAFGVATVEEGIELRQAGVSKPILVLTGADAKQAQAALEFDLHVALIDRCMTAELRSAARGGQLKVHLEIDTGMGRLGVTPEELPALLQDLRDAPELVVEGIFSHFANSDDGEREFTAHQTRLFRQALAVAAAAQLRPPFVHLANSMATLSLPETHFTMVRPGIALYGARPASGPTQLQPAMRLVTRLVQLKSVPAERPLGYDQTFVTRRPSRIATVPIGYADGYDRRLSNRAEVLVRGQRAPVVGSVCMDLILVDVTDVPGVEAHDEVVLWGRQGNAIIAPEEVAAWQGTIPYEVLARVGKRIPRVLKQDPAEVNG
jgi:alanine racemase